MKPRFSFSIFFSNSSVRMESSAVKVFSTPQGSPDLPEDAQSQPFLSVNVPSSPTARASAHRRSPTISSSIRFFLFSQKINILLIFLPLGIIAELAHWPATAIFALNFLAIIPLAKLLGLATEEIAMTTGETVGGLLNATFGNAVELIVSVVALSEGEHP